MLIVVQLLSLQAIQPVLQDQCHVQVGIHCHIQMFSLIPSALLVLLLPLHLLPFVLLVVFALHLAILIEVKQVVVVQMVVAEQVALVTEEGQIMRLLGSALQATDLGLPVIALVAFIRRIVHAVSKVPPIVSAFLLWFLESLGSVSLFVVLIS